jgi:CheY-like chemotaxis protein/LmbE family N-acetylglucosaminyl deacetylase
MGDTGSGAPRGRILIIEDDRVFGLWATKVLQANGYEAEHVLDPMSGLRLLEAERWDLVVTDIEMPRMSGLELLQRIRHLVPGLPVVVATAHPSVDRAVTALRHAATDFIHKPITAEDFVARIQALATQDRPAAAAAPESVLAIGAHPGDVELGAAGVLLAHQASRVAVTVLSLSQTGPDGTPVGGGGPGVAGEVIGTRLGPDDLADAEAGATVADGLARLIQRIEPTVLYTHSVHDSQRDHRDAHLAVVAAAGWIGQVYCFQSSSATIDFRPARFVPIDDHIDGKLRAVAAFAAQPEVRDFLASDQVMSTAQYWARYCQARHAEAFEVVRDRTAAGASAARPEAAQLAR